MSFQDDLRELVQGTLASRGWSKKKLAETAGIGRNALNDFFTGKHSSTLYVVDAIFTALDIRLPAPKAQPELSEQFRITSTSKPRTRWGLEVANVPLYTETLEQARKMLDHLLEEPTAIKRAWIETRFATEWTGVPDESN